MRFRQLTLRPPRHPDRAIDVDPVTAIQTLAWAGRQPEAISAATECLAAANLAAEERLRLLDLRAESQTAIGDFSGALADAQAMQDLARWLLDPAAISLAASRLSLVQVRQGEHASALRAARAAQAAARRAGVEWLEALALFRLAEAEWRCGDDAVGLRHAEQATARFEQLGDAVWQGRALWSQAYALSNLGRKVDATASAARALALAEAQGDQARLLDGERPWAFVPAAPWRPGPYRLAVFSQLEDAAGNRMGDHFEVAAGTARPATDASLDFVVR